MRNKLLVKFVLLTFVLTTIACGGLRFSQLAPEANDFHPKKIAVLPIEMVRPEGTKEVKAEVEKNIEGALIEKKWFTGVVGTESFNTQLLANEELNKAMTEYLSKLQTVNFSDPDLSKKIGELLKVDALLMVSVDSWDYIVVKDDKKAFVGMTMKLYEASTGKLMWKGGYDIKEDYMLIKPGLTKVARDVTRKLIAHMPH
jgi:hypothetical protein